MQKQIANSINFNMCAVHTGRSRAASEALCSAGANCCPEGAAFAGSRRSKESPSSGALFIERGAQLKAERNTEQDKKGYGRLERYSHIFLNITIQIFDQK